MQRFPLYTFCKTLISLRKPLRLRFSLQPKQVSLFLQKQLSHDGIDDIISLTSVSWSRLHKYIVHIHFFIYAFSILHHKKPKKEELQAGHMLAGFIPLYDDLMDQYGYFHEDVLARIKTDSPDSDLTQATAYFYRHSFHYPHQEKNIQRFLLYGGQAQNDSLAQKNPETDVLFLENITERKGGFFLLLVRCCLHEKISPEEEKMIYQLGALIQLLDDIFDIYKDSQEGIKTFPNQEKHVSLIKKKYEEWISRWVDSLSALSHLNTDVFLAGVALLLSSGWVCLQQFEQLEKASGGEFSPVEYTRKQLVCDMDKPINWFRAFLSWRSM